MTTPKPCACGCQKPARKTSKYYSDRCRERVWERKNPGSVARRQEANRRAQAPKPHEHVYVRYGDKAPVCFKCYFAERRVARNGRL